MAKSKTGDDKATIRPEQAKGKINPATLKRSAQVRERVEPPPSPPSVSAGPIDKVIELAFNPSRDKIREVTIIDRMQGRLFPLLDMINTGRQYILEVASYRQDREEYKRAFGKLRPIPPNLLDEYMFRTAQWQKSVAGKNLERATDIALAETEARAEEEEREPIGDAWKE